MPINLITQCAEWETVTLDYASIIDLVLKHLNKKDDRDVALVLTDNESIHTLNREFRDKDKPTNVLSFPSDERDEWGDIILAYETIAHEADEQGKAFEAHLTHLIIHGVLHLLGYDHVREKDASEMESLEIALLSQLGIANPYQNN